jgi:ribosome-associated translation inhibitor RaiA
MIKPDGRGAFISKIAVRFKNRSIHVRKAANDLYDSIFEAEQALFHEMSKIKFKSNKYSFVA